MNPEEYCTASARTDLPIKNYLQMYNHRLDNPDTLRLLHASMGLVTESGELMDAMKKHLFYGKPLDTTNLIEECGDLFWYIALLLNTLNVNMETVMQINVDKLKARYPEKFTEFHAKNRDLDTERKILENGG